MITKTINESKLIGYRLIEGVLNDFVHVELGKKFDTLKKASKYLRKLYNDDSIVIQSIELVPHKFEMSEEVFIANATNID